jgi:hypothetical protein
VDSQSRVEDTRAHSEENSKETTAVVPIQTANGTNAPVIYAHPVYQK